MVELKERSLALWTAVLMDSLMVESMVTLSTAEKDLTMAAPWGECSVLQRVPHWVLLREEMKALQLASQKAHSKVQLWAATRATKWAVKMVALRADSWALQLVGLKAAVMDFQRAKKSGNG